MRSSTLGNPVLGNLSGLYRFFKVDGLSLRNGLYRCRRMFGSPRSIADNCAMRKQKQRQHLLAVYAWNCRGIELMKTSFAFGLAACLLLPLAVGCSHQQIRAQSPDAPAIQQGGVQAAGCVSDNTQYIGDPNCQNCPQGYGQCPPGYGGHGFQGAYCPNGGYCPNGACQDGSCECCLKKLCENRHHHWYTYNEPKGLVYPQQNSPAAVVQYPYYTVRGPTDFFMK